MPSIAAFCIFCFVFIFSSNALPMRLDQESSTLNKIGGLQTEYVPLKPQSVEMGFGEAAWGQQKQNTIPKALDTLAREKPPIDLNWKNPVLEDPEVPPQFISNFVEASSQEEYDQIKERVISELQWREKVQSAETTGKLGVLASRILDPAVILICSLGLMLYFTISKHWFSKRLTQKMPRGRRSLAQVISTEFKIRTVDWTRFLGGTMGVLAAICFFILGIAQLFLGYVGVSNELGTLWAVAVVVVAFVFRFTLPLTIGSFFGAMNVWGWHWFASALFALPGLVFVIPGVFASMISSLRGNDA